MVCFVLFSFSHFVCYFFLSPLFFYILSLAVCPPTPTSILCLCPSSSQSSVQVLSFAEILKPFPSLPLPQFCCYLSHHLFYQHLLFPHSANLSPWHLSNSPCTHSVVPLIACSFTLPFFLSWLSPPWQSDNCWSIHC